MVGRGWLRAAVLAAVAIATGIVAVPAILLVALTQLPPSWLYWSEVAQTKGYIALIEAFKGAHGHYPDPTTQTIVPPSDTGPYFYEGGREWYCVGFNIGFDDAYRYCSDTRTWSYGLFRE